MLAISPHYHSALLIWDHVVTFGEEVSKIWSKKITGGSVLYVLLRYGTAVEKITIMLLASWGKLFCFIRPIIFDLSPTRCNIAVRVQIFPMILRTIAFSLFSSLRVYALTGKDWKLASFVLLLFLPSIIAPTYSYAHQFSPAVNALGCQLEFVASQPVHDHSMKLQFNHHYSTLTLELYHFEKDLLHAKQPQVERRSYKHGTPLTERRNPLLRCLADLVTGRYACPYSALALLFFDHVPADVVGYNYWVVPYYTPVFRTIIICRFLLMLRTIYFPEDNDENSHVASMRFASRIVGNLGTTVGDLDFSGGEDKDDHGDDIIYARNPFTTGLMLSEAAGSNVEEKRTSISDEESGSAHSHEHNQS
ncbi:hypothetical protein M422DRAFT_253165 [Sphaerobolus stellatus SS14]|uniref:DUF6533 domain-containing protein n=1 Tax=Sphaerobolus stellatus (strain SS14) TaxID=990650 RepID=A0A0C9V9C3_SPHS4|nr:hypothetical protein M422DRAFT_253165 [Sphaerobolus stellatus SS14]